MKKDRVLWADDEIELLKPHMLFLREKGYEVTPVISGQDAIERGAGLLPGILLNYSWSSLAGCT